MRPDLVVLPEPDIDSDLGLFGGVEPFGVEHFSTECFIEALVVSVLPRAAGIDLHWLDADAFEPVLELSRNKFWAVI